MKKRFLLILFVAISFSCGNNNKGVSKDVHTIKKETIKTPKEILASKSVELSFKGIALAAPFRKTIQDAIKHGEIRNVTYSKDKSSAVFKAGILLPDREDPLIVDVKVTSFQDTINSILVLSDVFETHESLLKLYTDRYGSDVATTEFKEDPWGDNAERLKSNSSTWRFKNQSINVTVFISEKREYYVKHPDAKYIENKYDTKYTNYFKAISILYNDIAQCEKAAAADAKEEMRQSEIERQRKDEQTRKEQERKKIHDEKVANQDI